MRMPKPWVKPWIMPSIIQFIQSAAPRAASAPTPRYFPTTMVSTTVYNCWNTMPTMRGRAKARMRLPGLPSVMLRMRADINFLPYAVLSGPPPAAWVTGPP